jgi:hypothetical protein
LRKKVGQENLDEVKHIQVDIENSFMLLTKFENEEFELMTTIAKRIWLHKNTLVFGGNLLHPAQLGRRRL